jgi:zinc/manganese transport system substrate-binding protein
MLGAASASAAIQVVGTTSSMGMLARTIGSGTAVEVTVLAPPDRDAHTLLAKPSMMVALRRADLLVAVGGGLEVGWLPAALQAANNPGILPGSTGYFEGAAWIDLTDKGKTADRAHGDVHPEGNPHYYMDPLRMARIAHALAARLGMIDPPLAGRYEANAAAFEAAVVVRVAAWKRRAAGSPGVVFYHKDGDYLAVLLGVPILGYIEPLPGIPPTTSHLNGLVRRLKGGRGVILFDSFHSPQGPEFLSRSLGWKNVQLQLECSLDADGPVYLDHIAKWVEAISSGKS